MPWASWLAWTVEFVSISVEGDNFLVEIFLRKHVKEKLFRLLRPNNNFKIRGPWATSPT